MRARLIVLLSALGGFLPLVTDGFLPAMRPMMAELGTDVRGAQLTLSLALAGFACAQLIVGMLADRYGRRPVLIVSIVLLALASVGVARAHSLAVLLTFRFLQGLSAAAGPVLMRAVVRDLCSRVEGARILSVVGMGLATIPLFIPGLNAAVTVAYGWRATLFVYLVFLAATLAMTLVWFKETLAARDPLALSPRALARTLLDVLGHRAAVGYMVCCVCGYAGLAVWISASAHLITGYFGQPAAHFGLYWAIPVATYVLGGYASARGLRRRTSDAILRFGSRTLIVAGMLLVALSTLQVMPLLAFITGIALYNFGWAAIQPQAQAGLLSFFPTVAGRVSAILGFMQMIGGALIGLLFGALHDGTPRAACLLMASAAVALLVTRMTLLGQTPEA